MKYEVPYIEIIRFEFKNILAATSNGDENSAGFDNPEIDGDEDMSYDPFA